LARPLTGDKILKTLIFAPETLNIAETTRMIEIAKESQNEFRCVFFGYSDVFLT